MSAAGLRSRPYAGAPDLRQMEEGLAHAYTSTSLRVGDLAWLSRATTHRQLALDIRLWEDAAGKVAAWTFFRNGGFNAFLAPGMADDSLVDEMLAVIDEAARSGVAAGDPPVALDTYAIDPARSAEDRALAAGLERAGFQVDRRRRVRGDGEVPRRRPPPSVPDGYHLDWVRTRDLLLGRVEAHRLAFAPSELTAKTYERLQRAWSYRPELDRVAVTDAGEVVAFCTAWLDESNAAGLLEPVGTAPAHQRRGLASAVCIDALIALRAAGARIAQVAYGSGAGLATYRSIGFEPVGNELVFVRR